MKSQDNFQAQIKWMRDILVSNTILAESINQLLKKINPQLLAQCVDVVIEQCIKKYPWTILRAQEHVDKLQSIKKALWLVKRERVTIIDELNINLAGEINEYYGHQYIQAKKQLPFSLKCKHCKQDVSNHQLGLKNHQLTCQKSNQNVAKQKTDHKDYQRKINKLQDNLYQSEEQLVSSKNQRLKRKKKQKEQNRSGMIKSQLSIEFAKEYRQKNKRDQQRHDEYLSQQNKVDGDGINHMKLKRNQCTRKNRRQFVQSSNISSDEHN